MHIIPLKVGVDIIIALMLTLWFGAIVAVSAKTGYVANSPWSARRLSKAKMKVDHDYTKLRLFIYLTLVTAVVSVALCLICGITELGTLCEVAALITGPSAWVYWYYTVAIVRDAD